MNDRQQYGYKGPVRQVVLDRPFSNLPRFIYDFDEQGNLLRIRFWDKGGGQFQREYLHDEFGQRITPHPLIRHTHPDGSWEISQELSTFVGPDSLSQQIGRPSLILLEIDLFRDISPALVRLGLGLPNNGASRMIKKFDSHGTPFELVFYEPSGEPVTDVKLEVDPRGNVVELAIHGGPKSAPKLKWFEKALTTSDQKYEIAKLAGPNSLLRRSTFKYNLRDLIIETEAFSFGKSVESRTYQYNEHDDVVSVHDRDAGSIQIDYAYDDVGNWLRQAVTSSLVVEESVRQVEYYD